MKMDSLMILSSKQDFKPLNLNMRKVTEEVMSELANSLGFTVLQEKYCCGSPIYDVYKDGKYRVAIIEGEDTWVAAVNGEIVQITLSEHPWNGDIFNSHVQKKPVASPLTESFEKIKSSILADLRDSAINSSAYGPKEHTTEYCKDTIAETEDDWWNGTETDVSSSCVKSEIDDNGEETNLFQEHNSSQMSAAQLNLDRRSSILRRLSPEALSALNLGEDEAKALASIRDFIERGSIEDTLEYLNKIAEFM